VNVSYLAVASMDTVTALGRVGELTIHSWPTAINLLLNDPSQI
jgi:hypothetical protein